ncbi:GntR family transcriptional regulator [Paracoccus suum]|nr:GntR family transcriptional regulator [Paracoccus suum]
MSGKLATSKPQAGVAALRSIGTPVLVREQAYDGLRDAIVNGQLPPGTRLVERELCEALGVSRTSLREALRRLEAQRLIQVEGRRGPTVARLTRDQASQIYTLRKYLEGELFDRLARLTDPANLTELTAAFDSFHHAVNDQDVARAVEVMVEFYAVATRMPSVDVIEEVLSELTARVSYLRYRTMSRPGRMEQSLREIRAIVEAVAAGDPERARAAAVEHIDKAATIALKLLDN